MDDRERQLRLPKSTPAERRQHKPGSQWPRERRGKDARGTLELVLDQLFRPYSWAARLAFQLRLQGAGGVRCQTHLLPVAHRRPGAHPLRIAFATDFHAGPMTDRRLLEQACASIDAAKPDVLLLGGDFVSVRGSCVSELAPLLGAIRAPLGRFAVLGNHDLRADRACIVDALESAGIEILTNRHVRLPAPHDDVAICGLDDPIRGQPDPTTTMDEEARVKIVLMHAPDGVLDLGDREFDLALCGHTHGGQITLPGGDAIVVPSGELSRRYSAGVYRLDPDGGRALLVSRGVGCSTIPIRMFANPEVHVITVG